jgi:CelD/BcsL family acetyltransferase involved in cellulose biosynthesis
MRSDRGSLFGSPPWLSAIRETYGFDINARVLEDRDGRATGALAYAELRDLAGDRIVCVPFSDYLDPVADSEGDWPALTAPLIERHLPVRLRVRTARAPLDDDRFATVGIVAWHATDLDRDEEEIHASFPPGARQNLRAARRHGVTVRFGSDLDDIRVLHDLHCETRKRKYGLLAQPRSFFENIWKAFAPADGIVVGSAIHEGEVIAAALYLVWNDVIYYKFGASRAERLSVRPNELLAWESLLLGRRRGLRTYDWGVSDLDQPGLVAYKQKFATAEGVVTVLGHTPAEQTGGAGRETGNVLGELTQLLTRDDVPDDVTRRAGEVLYRYFA